jgi:restriction system protein
MAQRKSSIIENLILCPWWVSLALAIFSYGALHAAPISLGLLCLATFSGLRMSVNSRMLQQQAGLDSLCRLSWKQFEDLVGEAYSRQGYAVKEILGASTDDGVDLILTRNGETTLVQCKRWRGLPVPVGIARELYSVLMDRRAAAAKLVATSQFTPDAVGFANGKPIELVDAEALLRLVAHVHTSGTPNAFGARS